MLQRIIEYNWKDEWRIALYPTGEVGLTTGRVFYFLPSPHLLILATLNFFNI